MSFLSTVEQYQDVDLARFFDQVDDSAIERGLTSDRPSATDFLALLSPRAAGHLEAMAQRAHELTVRNFGRTIQMFIPLYLANHCNNPVSYTHLQSPTDRHRQVCRPRAHPENAGRQRLATDHRRIAPDRPERTR